jgi:hypothetical protein
LDGHPLRSCASPSHLRGAGDLMKGSVQQNVMSSPEAVRPQ